MISPFTLLSKYGPMPTTLTSPPVSPNGAQKGEALKFTSGNDSFEKLLKEFNEDSELAALEKKSQEHWAKMEPALHQLRRISMSTKFPLEHTMDRPLMVPVNLVEYITSHPQCNELEANYPEALQRGLNQMVELSKALPQLPASQELAQINQYAYQYLSTHVLKCAAQHVMNNPGRFEEKTRHLRSAMTLACQNAKKDPNLKLEEKMMNHIEACQGQIQIQQQMLDTYQNQVNLPYLIADAFEPNPQAHPDVLAIQKKMHAIAKEESPWVRELLETELMIEQLMFDKKVTQEKSELKALLPLYFHLCDLTREKAKTGFSNTPPETHPLSDVSGFQSLKKSLA